MPRLPTVIVNDVGKESNLTECLWLCVADNASRGHRAEPEKCWPRHEPERSLTHAAYFGPVGFGVVASSEICPFWIDPG